MENYRGKKVLITGNTGFKGSWLTAWFNLLGAEVVGVSLDIPTEPSMYKELGLQNEIEQYFVDIRNADKVKQIIRDENPDYVFHLAAQPIVSLSYRDPLNTISTNVLGTANVLEALRHAPEHCVAVIITSDKCYNNVEWVWGYRETDELGGEDIYSGSKGAAELIFRSYYCSYFQNTDACSIATARAGNVIGGGDWARDRLVPDCVRAWHMDDEVSIRNPLATRPWQHVLEPLGGYIHLALSMSGNSEIGGESFNFGPKAENNHTVRELIDSLKSYWTGESGDEVSYRTHEQSQFKEANLLKLNCDKALHMLDWSPVLTFEEVVEFTGSWYSHYYQGAAHRELNDLTVNQIRTYMNFARERGLRWAQ